MKQRGGFPETPVENAIGTIRAALQNPKALTIYELSALLSLRLNIEKMLVEQKIVDPIHTGAKPVVRVQILPQ